MLYILYTKFDKIATITLNRPEALNALNLEMRYEILEALEDIEQDDDIRVVLITGAGRAFCSGGDVKGMRQSTSGSSPLDEVDMFAGRERLKGLGKVILKISQLEKPVIAAVNGVAAGAGFNLALACDLVIASEEARFVQSFVKLALVPDGGGFYSLVRRVGVAKAKELIFTGRMVEVEEAIRLGLVNLVVPTDKFLEEVLKFANQLADQPPKSMAISKAILNKVDLMDLATELEYEALAQSICSLSQDHREGVKAFFEKRPGQFKGR